MTHPAPLVSAIIPVHNSQAYLAEALTSVLVQTYSPIECIVIDDGSTDGSPDVAQRFGEQVRYVRQPHQGVAAARNFGARVAKGDFLAFLDSDDAWLSTKIERQMELLAAHPELGLVYTALQRVDRDGRSGSPVPAPDPVDVVPNILLQRGATPSIGQTGLLPRPVFEATGGFDQRLSTAADSDLAWRIAAQFAIAPVAEPLARYRSHPQQMHLDTAAHERDVTILLRKAFTSALLPVEHRALERRARTNLALTLAYTYRTEHRQTLKALVHLCTAVRLSPLRCATGAVTLASEAVTRPNPLRRDGAL